MIKHFCDLCKEEILQEQYYTYILPQRISREAISSQGQILYKYDLLEDKEIEVCDVCRKKIFQTLEEILIKEKP